MGLHSYWLFVMCYLAAAALWLKRVHAWRVCSECVQRVRAARARVQRVLAATAPRTRSLAARGVTT